MPRLEQEWNGTSVAHFSCHGSNGGGRAFLAHLRLADGVLLAHDVAHRLTPMPQGSGVILNGCETGAKDVRALDEAMGLTTAFLVRGASIVFSTHYSVEDMLVTVMVDEFTAAMQAGNPPTQALRRAQQKVRTLTVRDALITCHKVKTYLSGKRDTTIHEWRKVHAQLFRLCARAGDIGEAEKHVDEAYEGEKRNWFKAWFAEQKKKRRRPNYDETPFDHPYYWSAFHLSGRVV